MFNNFIKSPYFKPLLVLVIAFVLALATGLVFSDKSSENITESETKITETAEKTEAASELHIGAFNIIALAGLLGALAVITIKNNKRK